MNNYEEIKCIGNGSFGQVYLVKSKQDGQKYAVKTINIVDIKEKDRKNMENEVNRPPNTQILMKIGRITSTAGTSQHRRIQRLIH